MPRTEYALSVVVPGLLGPMPAAQTMQPAPSDRLLELLLTRARIEKFAGYDLETTLCALFGVLPDEAGGLPVAALRLVGQGGESGGRFWIQADPVCLRPDQDRLLLLDTRDMVFAEAEAQELAADLCAHFEHLGWRLQALTPHDWYLSLDTPPRIRTCSLGDAFGRNIDQYLPRGKEALRWHGLLNEIQMLFHNAPVNQRREARGEPTISGVWFHGGGFLPARVSAPFNRVYAQQPLAKGLAAVAAIAHTGMLPDSNALAEVSGDQLVVDDALQRPVWRADPFDWCEGVAEFSARLAALVDALRRKQFQELRLYPCNGKVYRINAAALRRFWRRGQPLVSWLEQNSPQR